MLALGVLVDPTDRFDGLSGWLIRIALVWALIVSFSVVADHLAAREFRKRRGWRDPPSVL